MEIGILGGAFNPPHKGHIVLAEKALEVFGLEKLIFVPTLNAPHKEIEGEYSPHLRLFMISIAAFVYSPFDIANELAFLKTKSYLSDDVDGLKKFFNYYKEEYYERHDDDFIVSDYEIKKSPDEKSYTIDTVNYFLEKHPEWKINVIMGADQAEILDTWHKLDELKEKTKICVGSRKGSELNALKEKYPFIETFEFDVVDISSSDIRKNWQSKKDYLPEILIKFFGIFNEKAILK